MSKTEFLERLRGALVGMAPSEVDDIVADYAAHFDEAVAAGRSDSDVAQALGDPQRLARELRVEERLRHWETQRTAGALVGAIAALGGMVALDVFILLPLLCGLALLAFLLGVALCALGLAGAALLLSGLLHSFAFASLIGAVSRMLAGLGLLGLSVGIAALLWLLFEGLLSLFSRYARLHYRVLKPA